MTSEFNMLSPDGVAASLQPSGNGTGVNAAFQKCNTQHSAVQKGTADQPPEIKAAQFKPEVDIAPVHNSVKLENSTAVSGIETVYELSSGDHVYGDSEEKYFERDSLNPTHKEEYRSTGDPHAKSSTAGILHDEFREHASNWTAEEESNHLPDGSANGESKGTQQKHKIDRSAEAAHFGQCTTESIALYEGSVSPTQRKSRINPFNSLPAQDAETPVSMEVRHPQHVMAEVHIRNTPIEGVENVREPKCPLKQVDPAARFIGRLQDSKSLDAISQVCEGARANNGKLEGRRATISSALELEGTVSHEGNLTHFVADNLQMKIKLSSRQSLDSDNSVRIRGVPRKTADIPPIDPGVLKELEVISQDVAQRVDQMMKSLNGIIQNMTALSVGYIQTYRDSVDSLGESVDMSIKGMYTLMARCEELDRSMQPIHALAKQIREIKRTLEVFETVCK